MGQNLSYSLESNQHVKIEQVLSAKTEGHHPGLVCVDGAANQCVEQRDQSVQMGPLYLPLEGHVIAGLPFVKSVLKDLNVREVVNLKKETPL